MTDSVSNFSQYQDDTNLQLFKDDDSLSTFEKHEEFDESLKSKFKLKLIFFFILISIFGCIIAFNIYDTEKHKINRFGIQEGITTATPQGERVQLVRVHEPYEPYIKMDLATISTPEEDNFKHVEEEDRSIDDYDVDDIPILKRAMIGTVASFFYRSFGINSYSTKIINGNNYPKLSQYISNLNGRNGKIIEILDRSLTRFQSMNFEQQLNYGVYFFDMRIDNEWNFGSFSSNAVYKSENYQFGLTVMNIFRNIHKVMIRKRKKIIIVNISKVWSNYKYSLNKLLENIVNLLGRSRVVDKNTDLMKESFRSLYKKRKKYILICNSEMAVNKYVLTGKAIKHMHFVNNRKASCPEVTRKFCAISTRPNDNQFKNGDTNFYPVNQVLRPIHTDLEKRMTDENNKSRYRIVVVPKLGDQNSLNLRYNIFNINQRILKEYKEKLKSELKATEET